MLSRLGARAFLILATFSFGAALLVAAPAANAATANYSADDAFVAALNEIRADHGLGQLWADPTMAAASRDWAHTMADEDTLKHASDITVGAPSDWRKVGENVGYGPSVASLVTAFMNSPGHRGNILDPAFTRIGVGTVVDGDGTLWTTHRFAATESQSPPTSSAGGTDGPTCFGQIPTIYAEPGVKTVGTAGDDVIWGTMGDDHIEGKGGNDRICGRGGNDLLIGNRGHDRIKGGSGHDVIKGKRGRDILKGNKGRDTVRGGRGVDIVKGGAGIDAVYQ